MADMELMDALRDMMKKVIKEELSPINERLEGLEEGQKNMAKRLKGVEEGQNKTAKRLSGIDRRLEGVEEGQKDMAQKLMRQGQRLDGIETKLGSVKQEITSEIKEYIDKNNVAIGEVLTKALEDEDRKMGKEIHLLKKQG